MHKILVAIRKVPLKLSGSLFVIFLILSVIVFEKGDLIKKIEVGNIKAIFDTTNNFLPYLYKTKALKYIFPALMTICGLTYLIGRFYKERIILIKHTSLNNDIAEVDSNFSKQYHISKTIQISQFDFMLDPKRYKEAIEVQDTIVNEICQTRNKCKLGYYGIAHIPLIFRLGFNIGDENNTKLLHKRRNNESFFEEFESTDDNSPLVKIDELNKSKKSRELLVSIATSLIINENELSSLHYKDMHYLKFEGRFVDFDSVISYKKAERLRNEIMIKIRQVCKKYGITKIHLVLASSCAFTFFLSQAFSRQHDPEIVVYHYLRGKYPWGIIAHEKPENAVVFNQN